MNMHDYGDDYGELWIVIMSMRDMYEYNMYEYDTYEYNELWSIYIIITSVLS